LASGDPCIITSGLTKLFGSFKAVECLDLGVERGQIFGFLGPNGAGKSTTIRMLLGLVKPTGGAANVLGYDVSVQRRRALKKVGAMVEIPAFYLYMTGRENVRMYARLSGGASESDIEDALRMVNLADRADDKVRAYSHGMRQRLGIASALVPRPELVILDEPTNGLDPEGVREVRDLVKRLGNEWGLSVFLSSHLLHEVEQTCTHVAVISKGALLAQGSVEELLGQHFGPVEFEVDRTAEAEEMVIQHFGLRTIWSDEARFAAHLKHSDAADINRFLVENGFKVSAIERRRQTLEDVYLRLVRGDGVEN